MYDDLTKGFAECLYNDIPFQYFMHLNNHDEFDLDRPQPLWPSCTLVQVREEVKTDGKLKGAHLFHMILYEEEHLFYAVTNSGLYEKHFKSGPPNVGSTITISAHSVIHGAYYTNQPLVCVLIHDLIYRPATTIQEVDESKKIDSKANVIIPDDVCWLYLDRHTVDSVICRGGVRLVTPKMNFDTGLYYLTGVSHPRIGSPKHKGSVDDFLNKPHKCDCCEVWYHTRCILKDMPVDHVDKASLVKELHSHTKINLDCDEWEPLPNKSKRICLYWFYACHVFHSQGDEARELPKCLMDNIRSLFPEVNGKYVGFKSTSERLRITQKRALEEMDVNVIVKKQSKA